MVTPGTLLKASVGASKDFFHSSGEARLQAASELPYAQPSMVPIRSIGPRHGERIAAHLLSLQPHDRYLRFGYAANDAQVQLCDGAEP